jgi:hypothetical protein
MDGSPIPVVRRVKHGAALQPPAFPHSLFNHPLRLASVDRVNGRAEVLQRIEGVAINAMGQARRAANPGNTDRRNPASFAPSGSPIYKSPSCTPVVQMMSQRSHRNLCS